MNFGTTFDSGADVLTKKHLDALETRVDSLTRDSGRNTVALDSMGARLNLQSQALFEIRDEMLNRGVEMKWLAEMVTKIAAKLDIK